MSGLVPLRSAEASFLPVEGSTGTNEWCGYLPQEKMPMLFNSPTHPHTHRIVTANHQIVPPEYPIYITNIWDPGYRARRISELLMAIPRLTIADYQRIQADVYSIPAAEQTRYFIAAGQASGGDAELAATLLQSWDYQMTSQSVPAAIYEVTAGILLREILEPLLGKDLYHTYSRIYFASWRLVLLSQLLSDPTTPFFGSDNDRAAIFAARDAAIAHAMSKGVSQLRAQFGTDSAKWQWGALHQANFAHPLAKHPMLNWLFGLRPLKRPGDSVTINVGGAEGFALNPASYDQVTVASMRMIIDLADWERSLWVITTGQSGQPFSPHYRDQVSDWDQGSYHPMVFSVQAIGEETKKVLMLKPLL
jgi:penicillin amidase